MKNLFTILFLSCFATFAVAEDFPPPPPTADPTPYSEPSSGSDFNIVGVIVVAIFAAIVISEVQKPEQNMETPLVEDDECFLKLSSEPVDC